MPNKFVRAVDGTTRSIPDSEVVNFNYDIAGNAVDTWLFVADGPMEVISAVCVPTVAGTDGGTVTAELVKASGTTAVASGTSLHASGTFNLKGTANTLQSASLSTTKSTRELAANDRVGVNFTGTLTSAVGIIQVRIKRIQGAGSEK